MSKQASILQYSRSDRSASRANRTPSTVDKNASSSHQPEPDEVHVHYAHRVASTFPHQEDNVRLNAHEAFGFQDLLATQGVPRDDTNMFREFNVHQGYAGGVGDEVDEDGSDEREFDESREGSNMRCSEDPDCLHSIHGSSFSRTSVSIKRKSFDTAIDPVSGKKELSLYGTSEFNNASCGREIGIILRTNFKGPWHFWDKVDAMCKDELFKEFKKKYAFPEEDEAIVRKIWEDKARTSLNQQLARARNKAMSIIGTTNIIDCLDKGPVWIQNEDWNTMINPTTFGVWAASPAHLGGPGSPAQRKLGWAANPAHLGGPGSPAQRKLGPAHLGLDCQPRGTGPGFGPEVSEWARGSWAGLPAKMGCKPNPLVVGPGAKPGPTRPDPYHLCMQKTRKMYSDMSWWRRKWLPVVAGVDVGRCTGCCCNVGLSPFSMDMNELCEGLVWVHGSPRWWLGIEPRWRERREKRSPERESGEPLSKLLFAEGWDALLLRLQEAERAEGCREPLQPSVSCTVQVVLGDYPKLGYDSCPLLYNAYD
uniref:Uncharacterized protein n=1 Tax=Salix viminalis TaxID=40686 RepID=A0A6N2M9Q7_SALVM